MKKDLTLLILAAGMGSRFGGLKQIEPVGPSGEFIIDYSIYDAIKAGFTKVVFIIKKENYEIFKETIGARIDDKIKVEYVFQDINYIPDFVKIPEDRIKPWGTSHAILAAKDIIKEPFGTINADDFYGRDAFEKLAKFLTTNTDENHYALIGYKTGNTLSENGTVNRGVCELKENQLIKNIECKVEKINGEIIAKPFSDNPEFTIQEDTLVSMNMFGFYPNLFKLLEEGQEEFFKQNINNLGKCEFLIPTSIEQEITNKKITVEVIPTSSVWHGISYREDKESFVKAINNYIEKGEYDQKLW